MMPDSRLTWSFACSMPTRQFECRKYLECEVAQAPTISFLGILGLRQQPNALIEHGLNLVQRIGPGKTS
jgi:hypothetical protein